MTVKILGEKRVLINLSKAIGNIQGNVSLGLEAAGKYVEGESKELTSIDTGVLINSTFSKKAGTKRNPVQVVGYRAEYAGHVHEMPDTTNWNRPGSENKFLEKAVVRNITRIINLIKKFASRSPR